MHPVEAPPAVAFFIRQNDASNRKREIKSEITFIYGADFINKRYKTMMNSD